MNETTEEKVKLTLINTLGEIIIVDKFLGMTVLDLKQNAIALFFERLDKQEWDEAVVQHMLVHVQSNAVLKDQVVLQEYNFNNGDELLLIKKRNCKQETSEQMKKEVEDVTKEMIASATENIAALNTDHSGDTAIETDLKKHRGVFVSLLLIADKLLCMNKDIAKLYKDAEKFWFEDLFNQETKDETSESVCDEMALQQLVEMGFRKDTAIEALIQNNNSVSDATNWLLADQNQPASDTEETGSKSSGQISRITEKLRESRLTNTTVYESGHKNTGQGEQGVNSDDRRAMESKGLTAMTGTKRVQFIVAAFKTYTKKSFIPDPAALKALKEMGFKEDDVKEALRMNGNQQQQACDMLLSGEMYKLSDLDVSEEEFGENSALYKKFRESPEIQVYLNKKKTFVALLAILDNFSMVEQWMSDPDIAALLSKASNIYNKHIHSTKNT